MEVLWGSPVQVPGPCRWAYRHIRDTMLDEVSFVLSRSQGPNVCKRRIDPAFVESQLPAGFDQIEKNHSDFLDSDFESPLPDEK